LASTYPTKDLFHVDDLVEVHLALLKREQDAVPNKVVTHAKQVRKLSERRKWVLLKQRDLRDGKELINNTVVSLTFKIAGLTTLEKGYAAMSFAKNTIDSHCSPCKDPVYQFFFFQYSVV